MQESKVSVLYYPEMTVSETTLKKAILLFDELHFFDRPSFTFGSFGTIGCASPLRNFEHSFREAGVPFYVHGIKGGPVAGEFLEQINSDINDVSFLQKFQDGIRNSETFRNIHIPNADYGEAGTADDVSQKIISVSLTDELKEYAAPTEILLDKAINHFDMSHSRGCAKQLVLMATTCSAKINFALTEGAKLNLYPLADARPYGNLLGNKYARTMNAIGGGGKRVQLTDLSFGIFDALVPSENLEKIDLKKIVAYRKASEKARKEFLEYINVLQRKQAAISVDDDYTGTIEKIVQTEIFPAVRTFEKKLRDIDETLVAETAKGAISLLGGVPAVMTILGDISLLKLLSFTGAAATYMAVKSVDRYRAQRAANRDCSISYILSLDKKTK